MSGDGTLRVTPGRNRLFSPFGVTYGCGMFTAMIGMIVLAGFLIACFSLNKPAVKSKLNLVLNSTEVSACQIEVNNGDESCVKDFYTIKRWRDLEWYTLYLPAPVALIALAFMIWWMYYNDSRILFWVMTLAWIAMLAVAGVSTGFDIYYISNCRQYTFCSDLDRTFAPVSGVKYDGPDWAFILHFSTIAGFFVFFFAFWVFALFSQYYAAAGKLALSFAQPNRAATASTDTHDAEAGASKPRVPLLTRMQKSA